MEPSPHSLSDVTIEDASEYTLEGWLVVHNLLIPNAPLTLKDAQDRLARHRLLVAVRGDEVVGSTTVRPPASHSDAVMVIARVLPFHQGRGIGTALYERALRQAHEYGSTHVMTCVLESSDNGLAFARAHGFTEIERYVLDGDEAAFVDLTRPW